MLSRTLPLKKVILFFLFLILAAMILAYPCYVGYLENVLAELPLNSILEIRREFLKRIVLPAAAILSLCVLFWMVFWKIIHRKK